MAMIFSVYNVVRPITCRTIPSFTYFNKTHVAHHPSQQPPNMAIQICNGPVVEEATIARSKRYEGQGRMNACLECFQAEQKPLNGRKCGQTQVSLKSLPFQRHERKGSNTFLFIKHKLSPHFMPPKPLPTALANPAAAETKTLRRKQKLKDMRLQKN